MVWLMAIVSLAAAALAVAAHLGQQLSGGRIDEHHAAAIGFDPIEDQPHDAIQQLIDVERMAHRQRRAVDHLQVAAASQPLIPRNIQLRLDQRATGLLAHRAHDARMFVGLLPGDDFDLSRDVAARIAGRRGVQQLRAADLQLIAGGQRLGCDALAVYVRAVGAAEIGQDVGLVAAAQLGVPARHLGVVNLNLIARVATYAERLCGELEAQPLVVAAKHEQRRHGEAP